MVLDLVVAFMLIVCALRGYLQGLASKLIGIAGLLTGYLAAMMLYEPLGEIVLEQWELPPMLAYGGCGVLVFFVVTTLFSVADLLRRRYMEKNMIVLTALDKALGATLGLLIGAVLSAVVILFAFMFPPDGTVGRFLQVSQSVVLAKARPLTDAVTTKIGSVALGDEDMGRIVSSTLQSPRAISKELGELLQTPAAASVLRDPRLMETVRSGDTASVLRDARVQELLSEPEAVNLKRLLSGDGEKPVEDAALLKMVASIDRLRSLPWARQLADNPEIRTMIEKGDIKGLMRHPEIGRLFSRDRPPQEP